MVQQKNQNYFFQTLLCVLFQVSPFLDDERSLLLQPKKSTYPKYYVALLEYKDLRDQWFYSTTLTIVLSIRLKH